LASVLEPVLVVVVLEPVLVPELVLEPV